MVGIPSGGDRVAKVEQSNLCDEARDDTQAEDNIESDGQRPLNSNSYEADANTALDEYKSDDIEVGEHVVTLIPSVSGILPIIHCRETYMSALDLVRLGQIAISLANPVKACERGGDTGRDE